MPPDRHPDHLAQYIKLRLYLHGLPGWPEREIGSDCTPIPAGGNGGKHPAPGGKKGNFCRTHKFCQSGLLCSVGLEGLRERHEGDTVKDVDDPVVRLHVPLEHDGLVHLRAALGLPDRDEVPLDSLHDIL